MQATVHVSALGYLILTTLLDRVIIWLEIYILSWTAANTTIMKACEPNNASGNTALKTGVGCFETPIQHPALFNGVYSVDN